MSSISVVRAVANRLTSTPIEDLTHQVGFLANSIANCKDVLQSSTPTSDQNLTLNKLKTRASSLLQDRTPDGRFCGIVISKALIEAGGLHILTESGSWTRNLISCLNKRDPWEVKSVCISAITRTYLLTLEHQQLVREITTPTLPAFISATLVAIKPATSTEDGKTRKVLSSLLLPVLRSWHVLIKHFASTFRPNASAFKAICLSLLSDPNCEISVQRAAEGVIARLHFCAPKNTATAEWLQLCSQLIEAAHDTADLVFRAVIEDHTSSIPRTTKHTRKQKTASMPSTGAPDVAGLEKWSGVNEGCDRLTAHLRILCALLISPHSQEVPIPLAAVIDLTARLAAVTLPTNKFALRSNNEITRDEREELWLNLPHVHASILDLLQSLVVHFGQALYPVSGQISAQLWEIFEAESACESIRSSTYELVEVMLEQSLLQITKTDSLSIRQMVDYCCKDLLQNDDMTSHSVAAINNPKGSRTVQLTSDAKPKKSALSAPRSQSKIYLAAYRLLPRLLTYVSFPVLRGGSSLRAQIESTSIILNHHEAILASVLNPARSRPDAEIGQASQTNPSLMPFLARSNQLTSVAKADCYAGLVTEALLRPRQPVITSTEANPTEGEEQESSEDDMAVSGDEQLTEQENMPQNEPETHIMEDNISRLATENQDISSDATSSAKRDFTALLEQSTDEQLAASISTDQPDNGAFGGLSDEADSASKRQRLEHAKTAELEVNGKDEQIDANWDLNIKKSSQLSVLSAGPEEMKNTADDNNGSSSSDDEIPPIDATLVGFDDSDDDDTAT